MLQKDPSQRASLSDIEAHHWLQGLDNPLLSPEPPPHWLSGALSPTSTRSGASECGDLLAVRPSSHQAFPGPWQPSLSLSLRPPPAEEPPVSKNLPALQQICEEEEEEEEDEEEEEEEKQEGSLVKEGEGLTEQEGDAEEMLNGSDNQEEEEDKAEMEIEKENEDSGCVISDQPVSHGDELLSQTPEVPPSSSPALGVSCCRGQLDLSTREEGEQEEMEPNNNTNKPLPLLPKSESCLSCVPAPSASLNGKETQQAEREGDADERTGERAEKPQPQNPLGSRDEPAPRAEQGKRHSIKLRERLFQFPLCEKALAFNIPSNNKPKILPLAQYNCCHVL